MILHMHFIFYFEKSQFIEWTSVKIAFSFLFIVDIVCMYVSVVIWNRFGKKLTSIVGSLEEKKKRLWTFNFKQKLMEIHKIALGRKFKL